MQTEPWTIITNSAADTRALAARLGRELAAARPEAGAVLALSGDLGAGKTTFVQGLACGLGIAAAITSPTFILVNRYRLPDGRRLHHADCYRLKDAPLEMWDIGLDDLLTGEDIVVIEWADRIPGLLPPDHLEVAFGYVDDARRSLTFAPHGAAWAASLARLQAAVAAGLAEMLDAPCH
ncbi:MAG: tRNA threonylcarbamoyladenosine biosynthesis protein TsaE [Chloroflexi bacterium ADurb.Bin325]|nr:MAG: tRNA threonylcarbamoyladenosine biosynthesis protein TsaE [Chloroflexi bacterium ADurb.Bin325]